MTDQYVEKIFLYFIVLSLMIHVAVFAFIWFRPEEKHVMKEQPYMVDIEDFVPPSKKQVPEPKSQSKVKRYNSTKNRVKKEVAPKGDLPRRSRRIMPERGQAPQLPTVQGQTQTKPAQRDSQRKTESAQTDPGRELFKRSERKAPPKLSKLYPSVGGLNRLEQTYRKKYGDEVEEGETKFLNTDDILFGSFLRRFETAVYGVWRYPGDAARLGVQGVTPVKITFNRKGEIENIKLLESSGSKILDDEVFRTLRAIGPIGSLPKGYEKESFSLIAFFQYGLIRGAGQGVLH